MKISVCNLIEKESLFCPSTGEILYDPETGQLNFEADALIAAWHQEIIDEPETGNVALRNQWNQYFDYYFCNEAEEYLLNIDILTNFLREYNNPEWMVYECTMHDFSCGPIYYTVWCVVKADTRLEILHLNP